MGIVYLAIHTEANKGKLHLAYGFILNSMGFVFIPFL